MRYNVNNEIKGLGWGRGIDDYVGGIGDMLGEVGWTWLVVAIWALWIYYF